MTFTEWLRGQEGRNDVVGDLSYDAIRDETWQKRRSTLHGFRRYLRERDACEAALKALDRAFEEWIESKQPFSVYPLRPLPYGRRD